MRLHRIAQSSALSFSATVLIALISAGVASADSFTTVNLSPYVNSNYDINPQTYPVGTSKGNQGTGIPFKVANYGGYAGMWLAQNSGSWTLTIPVSVSGGASFYALLNNYYGTPGANEYNITISASNGDSVTYSAIGGVNTRDFNENPNTTNSIASTTTEWFDNGVNQRMDVREFTLPSRFSSETITSFAIEQVDFHDSAILGGLTFSSAPASFATPEPESWALMMAGFTIAGLAHLRRKRGSRLPIVKA